MFYEKSLKEEILLKEVYAGANPRSIWYYMKIDKTEFYHGGKNKRFNKTFLYKCSWSLKSEIQSTITTLIECLSFSLSQLNIVNILQTIDF